MDPFTMLSVGIQAVGFATSIFGGNKQANASKAYAQQTAAISADTANQEMAINRAKLRQMELEGRRTQLQNIRNAQRARAIAVQSATTQGAQFGTGLEGGLAQVQQQAGFNMLGVSQALGIGREIAGYNDKISANKISQAQVNAQYGEASAEAQGISSLGGALMKVGPVVGAVAPSIFSGFGSGQTMTNPYNSMPKAGYDF